jgi:hypothetical protein
LLQSPISVTSVNMASYTLVEVAHAQTSACQSGEVLPAETSAIRLRMYAYLGPRVELDVLAHGHVIAHGERGSGWTGGVVTVPVSPLTTARSGVELCFTLFIKNEPVELVGEPTPAALAARGPSGPLAGRARVEYLKRGRASWLSIAPEVARHMGLGHAPSGTWSVLLVLVLIGALIALCSRLIIRELG